MMRALTGETLDMFAPRPRARRYDPPTSHAAAESMVDAAATQRGQIAEALRDASDGMIAADLDALFGWRDGTAGRRMKELIELGAAADSRRTRKTPSGRAAIVYVTASP